MTSFLRKGLNFINLAVLQVYVYFTCQFIMNISFLILLLITKKELINFCQFKNHIITRHFTRKKILGLGPGCEPKPKPNVHLSR